MPSTSDVIHNTPSRRHRFHFLDGLRGLAALVVVWWHASLNPLHLKTASGYLSVDFFFCLSGFVVAFSYESRLMNAMSVRTFMTTRIIRLYPVYLFGTLIGLAATFPHMVRTGTFHASSAALAVILQLFVVPNVHLWPSEFLYPFDMPAWSLFFELIASAAYAVATRARLTSGKLLVLFSALCFGTLIYAQVTLKSISWGFNADATSWLALPRIGFSFAIGVLCMRAVKHYKPRHHSGATGLALAAFVTTVLLALLLYAPSNAFAAAYPLLTVGVIMPALVLVGSVCNLPLSINKICEWGGNLSYPVYLIHYPFNTLLGHYAQWSFSPRIDPTFISVIPLTCIVAYLALRYFDEPTRAFLTRSFNRRQEALTAVPAVQ